MTRKTLFLSGAIFLVSLATALQAQSPANRIAAFGQVSPGNGIVTVAVPYYLGTPQVISELSVEEGAQVIRNQKLAVTTNRVLAAADLAIAQARLKTTTERLSGITAGPKAHEIAAQEALVKSLDAEISARKRNKATNGSRPEDGLSSDKALDWKLTASREQLAALQEVRASDVAIAQAEIAEAEAAVAHAEALYRFTEVNSPVAGQVLKVLTYPGETGAGQGLLEIGQTQTMRIKAEVSVADALRLKVGARAMIKSEAWRGEIGGVVENIRPKVERGASAVPSTFSNVDRVIVQVTIVPDAPDKLAALTGAEVTALIDAEPAAK